MPAQEVGLGPSILVMCWALSKPTHTRVGEGPFPTELEDETGEFLRKEGHEVGATTGRPRRCGWLDVVLVRYAVCLNGITSLAVTKLDVLDRLETILICVGYKMEDGQDISEFPFEGFENLEPVYEEMPGWKTTTVGINRLWGIASEDA